MADEMAKLQVRIDANTARFDQGMRRTRQNFDRQAQAIETRAARVGSRMSRQLRASFGNVGQQIQDVAVQAQMGTDSFRILAQQGPQIAGAFGPVGAVLGAFIAIGAALAPTLLGVGDAIEDVGDATERLTKAQASLTEAQDLLGMSLDELRAKFGDSVEEVVRLRAELANLAVARVRDEMASLAVAVGDAFESMSAPFVELERSVARTSGEMKELAASRVAMVKWREAVDEIAEAFGISEAQAVRLNQAMQEFARAKTFEEKSAELENIRELLDEVGVEISALPKEIRGAFEEMGKLRLVTLEAEAAADDLEQALARGAETTGVFTNRMTLLKNEAAEAARQARIAFDMASTRFSLRFRDEEALMGLPVKPSGGPGRGRARGGGGGRARAARPDTTGERLVQRMDDRLKKLREERALVGLSEEAHARLAAQFDRERLVRELLKAAAKENSTLTAEDIKGAKEVAAAIEAETLARFAKEESIRRVNDDMREHKRRQQELADSVRETSERLIGAVQSADSFADAIKRVGFEILQLAAQGLTGQGPFASIFGGAFSGIFGGIFGGGGGGIGGLGGIFGSARGNAFSRGNVLPFARGGIVSGPTVFPMARGVGLMGEAGPEGILPLRRGRGGRLGVEMAGGGGMTIVQHNVFEGVNAATRAVIQQELARQKSEIMREVPQVAAHGMMQRPALKAR